MITRRWQAIEWWGTIVSGLLRLFQKENEVRFGHNIPSDKVTLFMFEGQVPSRYPNSTPAHHFDVGGHTGFTTNIRTISGLWSDK